MRLRMGGELRAHESSADLVQSVCREILEHRERFQHPDREGFRRWLYASAGRKIANRLDYWRAAKRDAAGVVPLDAQPGSVTEIDLLACYHGFCTASRELQAREEIERIETTFDRLPEHYREVISLARIAGLSHAEIGSATGRSEPAVRKLLSRALAKLAQELRAAE